MLGCPPVVIVSEQAVREFTDRYYVSKAAVQYKESYDEETESAVLSLMDASPDAKDFSYTSRIREAETVKSAQGNMMEVGIGVAAVLAFIGILNYINTVIGNIQSRKRELAALESIGMTDRADEADAGHGRASGGGRLPPSRGNPGAWSHLRDLSVHELYGSRFLCAPSGPWPAWPSLRSLSVCWCPLACGRA